MKESLLSVAGNCCLSENRRVLLGFFDYFESPDSTSFFLSVKIFGR